MMVSICFASMIPVAFSEASQCRWSDDNKLGALCLLFHHAICDCYFILHNFPANVDVLLVKRLAHRFVNLCPNCVGSNPFWSNKK